MLAATAIALYLALDSRAPCADSTEAVDAGFWFEESWGSASPEPCDPDEALLFPDEDSPPSPRDAERASFSLARTAGGTVSTTRHQARRDGWTHRLEIRGAGASHGTSGALTRRELAWTGEGWKVAGGDLVDADLSTGPPGFPRRALPGGWRASRQAGRLAELASPRPQGLAAGVFRPRWQAYALRAWNPVESGREPAWAEAWTLSHAAAGVSVSLPWKAGAHFAETRVARGDADSVSERVLAARLASPKEDWALYAALSEARASSEPGVAVGFEARHRFDASTRVEASLRQRTAAWVSSWDPGIPKDARPASGVWGAGEYHLAATFPVDEGLVARAENWRSWNPTAGAWRRGTRARLEWSLEDFRAGLMGTSRASRAASGTRSIYRALEAEARVASFPRWRAEAWRAWNGTGPIATGLFLGAEPAWERLKTEAGLRIETDRNDRLELVPSAGVLWKFARGWSLDAGGTWPGRARDARGRVTANYNASGRTLRSDGAD